MAINVNKKFRAIGAHQIGELTSIYDDFLYIARGHENFLHKNSAFDLANIQMSSLNMNRWDFETLYTEKSKIVTNKNLRVTEYTELNSHMPFGRNEKTLIDYRHSLTLDSFGKIKEFKFKKQGGEFLRTRFASDTKGIMVVFPDKTIIYQSGPRIKIYHNGTILNFNNRREFANTYAAPQNMALQTIPAAKVR